LAQTRQLENPVLNPPTSTTMTAATCCKITAVLLMAMLAAGDARRVQAEPRLQTGAEATTQSSEFQKALAKFMLAQDPSAAFAQPASGIRSPVAASHARTASARNVPIMQEIAEQIQPQPKKGAPAKIVSQLLKAKAWRDRMFSRDYKDPTANGGPVMADTKKPPVDISLFIVTALWYLGNYYFNINNKLALNAAGGATGYPISVATTQLGVGAIYAMFLWLAPDARDKPKITKADYISTLPVGFCMAGAHAATVFAMSAGAVSFAQIVKAAEPAFAALIGVSLYGAKLSTAKWLALIPVIGGVSLASLGELDFAVKALLTAALANVFASFRGNEFGKMMKDKGISERLGSVGNNFAVCHINSFLFLLPLMFGLEGFKFGGYVELLKTNPVVLWNAVLSGIWFYLYNELNTIVISKTNAVTMSVLNTAKRVIVIVCVALVMGESLGFLKLLGSGIGISGVFLYSMIDKLVAKKDKA